MFATWTNNVSFLSTMHILAVNIQVWKLYFVIFYLKVESAVIRSDELEKENKKISHNNQQLIQQNDELSQQIQQLSRRLHYLEGETR